MTFIIYDYHELEERASTHLRSWKVCHITLYVLAVVFGILNYTFLFHTEQLVHGRCIFYPQNLTFHWVQIELDTNTTRRTGNDTIEDYDAHSNVSIALKEDDKKELNAQETPVLTTEAAKKFKRQAPEDRITTEVNTTVEENKATMITVNKTHRYMLDPIRTFFPKETDTGCQLGEYMPILSTVFATVWATLFIMCPNGGRTRRTGLQNPWRILAPALVFALVMVIMTGVSFTSTNGGLLAFCAAFQNYTNTTTCSAVKPFLEYSWNLTVWDFGHRVAATRAAAAGVWALWACACALLLARCLTAADFVVRHTTVQLLEDPQQKVIPHLKRQMAAQGSSHSAQCSPSNRDAVSAHSEPTAFTELVTASVENEPESEPTSVYSTPEPVKKAKRSEELEMVNVTRTTKES